MVELITYILKNIIALGLFALAYRLIFLQEVNFKARRFFMLNGVFLSFLLPLLSYNFGVFSSFQANPLGSFVLDEITIYSSGIDSIKESSGLPFSEILVYSYLLVAGILALRIIYQLINIIVKTKRYHGNQIHNIIIYRLPFENVSFSFFRYIFIGKTPEDGDLKKILAHEKIHAMQLHTLDVLIMELLSVIFWFNPLIWWYRNELKNVHEYLADAGALKEGFNAKSYQITILEHLIGSASLTITNNFNYSLIKNRIAMMNKAKNGRKKTWKLFLLLPVSILLVIGFACTEKAETEETGLNNRKSEISYESAYTQVDIMPVYAGGFMELRKFVALNLVYPKDARDKGIEGKVFVQFVVDKNGDIVTNAQKYKVEGDSKLIDEVVVTSYEPAEGTQIEGNEEYIEQLKAEAVRVLSTLPQFESPAMKDGKPVAVAFTFPINFVLQ